MNAREVLDYIANECGENPLFDRYCGRKAAIVVTDGEGNEFEVSVSKIKKGKGR